MHHYVTTAIDYPNATPHLGTAYEKVTADVIARYLRMRHGAENVHFLMGNDEHSTKVARRAAEEGLTPLAWCDRMEQAFKERWKALDISFDDFIRTSQPRHHLGVKELLLRIRKNHPEDLYQGEYEGWFCQGCEGFKTEKDLVNGECKLHPGKKADWLKEKNWKFRLSRYQEPLLKHFAQHPRFLEPESRKNEILAFLKERLEDLSFSRTGQPWGIPFPWDPESVVYVWPDALTNYISAIGFGSEKDQGLFKRWWAPEGQVLHIIGKDITRFHCVYWPAMLMAAGVDLPQRVFGHGWISFQGERMSKTLGNIVEPLEVVSRFGPDPLRLYLVREVVYGGDGDFTWSRFEERYNADLANNYGNLVKRLTDMAVKYRDGKLASEWDRYEEVKHLRLDTEGELTTYREAMDKLALNEAAERAFRVVDVTNRFIQDQAPWTLAKLPDNAARLDSVLSAAAEGLRIATILLHPVMPGTTARVLKQLGQVSEKVRLESAAWGKGQPFHLTAGEPLFPRLEKPKPSR